jgi:hypothetical protein
MPWRRRCSLGSEISYMIAVRRVLNLGHFEAQEAQEGFWPQYFGLT